MAICFLSMAPKEWGIFYRPIVVMQIFVLEFSKDGLADLEVKFKDTSTSSTAGKCMSLKWPGVSGLWPV